MITSDGLVMVGEMSCEVLLKLRLCPKRSQTRFTIKKKQLSGPIPGPRISHLFSSQKKGALLFKRNKKKQQQSENLIEVFSIHHFWGKAEGPSKNS